MLRNILKRSDSLRVDPPGKKWKWFIFFSLPVHENKKSLFEKIDYLYALSLLHEMFCLASMPEGGMKDVSLIRIYCLWVREGKHLAKRM